MLCYAESADGVAWRRDGRVCLDFATPDEHAFGRPCVVRDADGIYRMWYSVRGAAYYQRATDLFRALDDRRGLVSSLAMLSQLGATIPFRQILEESLPGFAD